MQTGIQRFRHARVKTPVLPPAKTRQKRRRTLTCRNLTDNDSTIRPVRADGSILRRKGGAFRLGDVTVLGYVTKVRFN